MDGDDKRLLSSFEGRVRPSRVTADTREDYEAFKAVDSAQPALFVKPVSQPGQWLNYRYWLHTIVDEDGTRLDVIFSYTVIIITGRNLFELAEAIARGHCRFVHQFDPIRWNKPKDHSKALVETIAYVQSGARKERGRESA